MPASDPHVRTGRNVHDTKDKANTWAAGMSALGQLKKRGDTQPYAAPEIDAALKVIKSQHGFSLLQAKAAGDQWEIYATLGKDSLCVAMPDPCPTR